MTELATVGRRATAHLISIVRSVLTGLVTVFVAGCGVYLLLDVLPGDAAAVQAGRSGQVAVSRLRTEWGLDAPPLTRLWRWLGGLAHGDLGLSRTPGNRPVFELLEAPLQRSVFLVLLILIVACLIGIPAGIAAGLRAGKPSDKALSLTALLLVGLPEFVLGALLVAVLAIRLRWFEAVSLVPLGEPVWAHPKLLVLPALTVAIPTSAMLMRMVRAVVIDQANSAHVEAAQLAGLPRRVVLRRHLLPGAWPPIAQVLAMLAPALLGGTVITERLFGFPGIGSLLVAHIGNRDTPTVAATVGLIAVLTVVCLRLADRKVCR